MSNHAILLVLLSACLHATWNLISKSASNPLSFLKQALAYSALLYAPFFIWMQTQVHYQGTVVICLIGSGLFCSLYFFCLGKAYQCGKISVAYPVARSFPILVVTIGGLFLHEMPSVQGLAGVILVVAGCFLLPWQRFVNGPDGFCLANYRNASIGWAMGAAVCTAAYSLFDKVAASAMQQDALNGALEKINYVYLQNAISWIGIALFLRLLGTSPDPVPRKRALICGALFLISYSLILLALATDPVAYVVSFRQLSIVLATIISMIWIERKLAWPRLVGVIMIFSGIVMIGLA